MIRFGIREYVVSTTPLVYADRVVAYDENSKVIPFDTDMTSYIGTTVACIYFNDLGKMIKRAYARLEGISVKHDPNLDKDTWILSIRTYPESIVNF